MKKLERGDLNCTTLYSQETKMHCYCFAKAVHSWAKLRTVNSLFFHPFVRPFMSCPTTGPTPHVKSFGISAKTEFA